MSEQFKKDQEKLEKLQKYLEENGYFNLQVIEGRGICGLEKFLFTVGLCYGLDEVGRKGRYCYPYEYALDAVLALAIWDGKKDPGGRWIKHKGYIGEYGNPKTEHENR